jgi:hypothetical protein
VLSYTTEQADQLELLAVLQGNTAPAHPPAGTMAHILYECQYGQPEAASTAIYRHPWSDHDYMGLAAEMEILRDSDDGFRVRLIAYSWNVWEPNQSPTAFERFNGCTVQVWDTHETFGQFEYARAFAQFAWGSWRASGSGGAAGMRWRDDLDNLLNPVAA